MALEYVSGEALVVVAQKMLAKHPPLGFMISKKIDPFALLIAVAVIKSFYFKDATTGIIQRQFGSVFSNLCKP